MKNPSSKSRDLAIKHFKLAADQGLAVAQCSLAVMYEGHDDVHHTDYIDLYRLAAKQGLADAQCRLGTLYEYGNGVSQDNNVALNLYKLAADQYHVENFIDTKELADFVEKGSPLEFVGKQVVFHSKNWEYVKKIFLRK